MHTFIFLLLIKNVAVVVSGMLPLCQIRTYACRFFGQSKHTEAEASGIQGSVLKLRQMNL